MRNLRSLIVGVMLVGVACTGGDSVARDDPADDQRRSGDGGNVGGLTPFARRLAPFGDCNALLDYFHTAANERVGAYGLDGNGGGFPVGDVFVDEAVGDAPDGTDSFAETPTKAADESTVGGNGVEAPAAPSGGLSTAGDDAVSGEFTTTNVQELGVDEPDIVKTDGKRIVVISDGKLSLALLDGEPRLSDSIQLPEGWGHELFLSGDRAIVLTNAGDWGRPMPIEPLAVAPDTVEAPIDGPGTPAALLLEVDISDPSSLRIAASMRIEGQYLSARAIGDTVRLAVSSGPDQLPWLYPSGPGSEQRAIEANQATVDQSTLEDWLPSFRLTTDDSSTDGTLLDCERTNRPAEFAGFDVISILDLDLNAGLAAGFTTDRAVGVVAGGSTVYSSLDRFYVATTTWTPTAIATIEGFEQWSETYYTDLHSFAIAPGEPTVYVGSGAVEGSLLNQFSLDEHDGYLRVITTTGSPWGGGDESESQLIVLDEDGDQLVEVGRASGLGKGEQLYAARILDDVGFAVTFRQIDPFYVIDLSDPTNPKVTGELKIPGFSTYLHPIGADRVLGIGQGNDDFGNSGTKLSLFDVSDPANPREVTNRIIPQASSLAETDHRAFQIIGTTAILPIQSWGGSFNGAMLFDVGGDAIVEIGRVSHSSDEQVDNGCRPVTQDDVPVDSEFFWRLSDGYTTMQICEPGARGGSNDFSYCDTYAASDLEVFIYDPAQVQRTAEQLDIADDDRIELCYVQSDGRQQIQRSLVVDGTLWTMSQLSLQGNDLETLSIAHRLSLAE